MPDTDMRTRLLALHVRRPWNWVKDGRGSRTLTMPDRCDHCRADWPCATVALIEAHLCSGKCCDECHCEGRPPNA